MQGNSKLIVIEGLDGSGKSTQFEILKKHFDDNGINVKAISFPDYDQPSSSLVKMYLGGEFSDSADGVNAYAASSFYAVDRYASYKLFWEKEYKSGTAILAARYVTSNAIYQMTKLDKSEWDNYLAWLEEYEYCKLELPRPDLVIFLDMPIEVSQKLLSKRYKGNESKKDIHESNCDFLKNCREAALYTAHKQDWKIIDCSFNDEPLPIETITEKIKDAVKQCISW